MKTRILSAGIGVPVLLLLLLVAPQMLTTLVFGVLLAIGAYEYLYRTGLVRRVRMVLYASVAAFALSLWSYYGGITSFLMLGLIVYFMLLFSEVMMDHVKVSVDEVGLCVLGGFLIPYLLSALIRYPPTAGISFWCPLPWPFCPMPVPILSVCGSASISWPRL